MSDYFRKSLEVLQIFVYVGACFHRVSFAIITLCQDVMRTLSGQYRYGSERLDVSRVSIRTLVGLRQDISVYFGAF